jgi:hypothetical protein
MCGLAKVMVAIELDFATPATFSATAFALARQPSAPPSAVPNHYRFYTSTVTHHLCRTVKMKSVDMLPILNG